MFNYVDPGGAVQHRGVMSSMQHTFSRGLILLDSDSRRHGLHLTVKHIYGVNISV